MKHAHFHSTPRRQRGAVLAIGLLILVVMTLIGVTGMSTSGLELKMAGNLADWNIAFQAVEAALRDGETDVATTGRVSGRTGADCLSTGSNPEYDGLCGATPGIIGTQNIWEGIDFSDNASNIQYVLYGDKTEANTFSGVATQPRYIIEPVVDVGKPGTSLVANTGGVDIKTYRITAVGYGGSVEANVMAQSTYVLP